MKVFARLFLSLRESFLETVKSSAEFMSIEMRKVRLGFVPLHRYPFDEKWGAEIRKRVIDEVSKIPYIELVYPDEGLTKLGLVWDDQDAEKVIDLFKEKGVEGLLLGTMTFGDELAGARIAEEFKDLPIAVFGTKEPKYLPGGFRRSDSFCGTLSVSSGLYRRKIPFTFLGVAFPEEPEFAEYVRKFAGTCMAVREFLGARIGLVGPRPERFETCAYDELPLIEQFGQRVVPLSLLDLFTAVRELSDEDPEVVSIVRDIRERAEVEVSDEVLVKSAKLELALKDFARSKGLSGMGVQCWTAVEEEYGISPCLAMGRLTDQGIMCACEVDILGVLTMLIQYSASMKRTVPHFIDWTIRHQEDEDTFLAWHCGNAPMSLAGGPICIRGHSILDALLGEERVGGTAEMQLKPGAVTLNRLVEYEGRFKLLVARGEIVPSDQKLRGSWAWVKVPDLDGLYRTLVEEGFVHHASLVHGDLTWEIREFCKFAGIEVVEV